MVTRLYNAGTIASNFHIINGPIFAKLTDAEKGMRGYNKNFLESYHYVKSGKAVKKMRADKMRVFLDSGAFTAWSKGAEIDLDEYIDFCHEHTDILEMISVLDVIDFDNPQRAAKESFLNLLRMEQRGLKDVLPTFHMGEPEEVIQHYAENYKYISLGGMVGVSAKQLMVWLDRIWSCYLTDSTGHPKLKVHGFGITSLPAMTRYPWTSVDSSTWVQWAANGMILMPDKYSGQINVSSRSSFRKSLDQHITTFRPSEQRLLEEEIVRHGGDLERIATFYYSRWAWNYWAFPKYLELNPSKGYFIPEWTGIFDAVAV